MSSYFVLSNKKLKYARAFYTLGFILSNYLLSIPKVYAFKFNKEDHLNSSIISSFTHFIPLLNKHTSVCIKFKNEDLVHEFIEVYKKYGNFSIVIIDESGRSIKQFCVVVVMAFESKNSSASCGEIFEFESSKMLLSLIDDVSSSVVSSLEVCLSAAQTPEVLVLSLSDSSLLQLSPVFPWPRHFVNTSLTEVLQRRAHKPEKLDLQGSTVKVAIMYYIPFTMFQNKNSDLQLDELDGIEALLLKELIHRLNGSVRFVITDGWGVKFVNGSWSGGVVQNIRDRTADLAFAGLWQIISAYEVFDLGPSLNKVKLAFMVRRPEQIDFRWQSFLTIFKSSVWIAVLVSFLLVVIVYWAGVHLVHFHSHNQSWPSCVLTIFGYFLATYSQSRQREGNTRFTLTSWAVFSLLFTTSLSSGIITRLTIPLYEARVDSLQQLVEDQYYWTVQYYRDYNNDPDLVESIFDLKNKWARMFEKKYKYMEPAEVLMKIKTDRNISFPVQRYGNDFVIVDNDELIGHEELHKFRLASEEVTSSHVTFGVQKNFPLFEQLSVATLNILEAGLMTHWKEEVIRRWPQSDTRHLLVEQDVATFSEPQILCLNKLQPIFFVLLFGSVLAFFVFFVEVFW